MNQFNGNTFRGSFSLVLFGYLLKHENDSYLDNPITVNKGEYFVELDELNQEIEAFNELMYAEIKLLKPGESIILFPELKGMNKIKTE